MEIGTVTPGISAGTIMQFQAVDFAGGKLSNLQNGIVVKIDGTEVSADRVSVDYQKGLISVTMKAEDAGKTVTATYKALHYGTPSWADFKGVHGAMYVLLKK